MGQPMEHALRSWLIAGRLGERLDLGAEAPGVAVLRHDAGVGGLRGRYRGGGGLVRPSAEYESGHIGGARSTPIAELLRHLRALPPGAAVVAYCRGPYCVYADEAVRELNRLGFRAWRLIDGFPEWKQAGLPVAASARTEMAPGGQVDRRGRVGGDQVDHRPAWQPGDTGAQLQ
jgi:rhodanese-related sulfurtransferase